VEWGERQSGAADRSRRTKKRAIEAAAAADDLVNVNSVETLTVDGAANAVHGTMASTRIISPVKEHKQSELLNSVTEGWNSVFESETAVNLANNGTGTVIYDQPEAQEQTTDKAEVEATTEAATTNMTVTDQEKATAEATAALAVTEVATELATKQAADKASTDVAAAGDEDTESNNNNNNDTNNHINDDNETVFNSGRWSETEIEKCAQSLYPNCRCTSYVTMGENVTIRSIQAIIS